ncbi:AvrE-family type 3 secretion system effector [Pseudomonas sp. SWRI18]|uniref:AvrE-family type 3 secretion system effector n=1 Tax=Pseudomonas sp. SWRI18 TaxID=2753888 RepID=UPI001647F262|nr:AvrE-family type 3 secretion system effector [Pseudomonas sp. SWRI18]MBC3300450.1 AvrE-family type 3 secretion system effector [Pseudomonas sp. SWRI18]
MHRKLDGIKSLHDVIEPSFKPVKNDNSTSNQAAVPVMAQPHYQSLNAASMLCNIRLEGGRLEPDGSLVGRDIASHLNAPDKHYVADGSPVVGSNTLRFKDERHHLFHIQPTPAVAAVFKSSLPDTAGGEGSVASLSTPGRAHLGSISGVQTTAEGKQFRLEEGRLYRFEPLALSWLPDADNQAYSRLGLTREGQLLKTPQGSLDSSAEGRASVVLSQAQGASVVHVHGADSAVVRPVDENGAPVQLARIGLAGNALYGATVDGELLRADVRLARDGVLAMTGQSLESMEQALKGAVRVEGFFHDDTGQLNVQVRDARRQLHSSPLGEANGLRPQWNLSDVWVKGIEKGLPLPSQQALTTAIDLGQRGKVAFDSGKLLSWDPRAQRWDNTAQQNVAHLERGLDGRAYALQEGQLKAVTIQKVRDPVFEGASYELSTLPKPRPNVSLVEVLAGNSRNPVRGFAVADGRNFVTVNKDHQLQVCVDGVVSPLRLSPALAIKTLALDHEANLYTHTQDGGLFRLDRQAWQGSDGAAHNWTKLELPERQSLESLRMGADKHLIGGWDKQFHRLDKAAPNALEWGPLRSATQVPLLADTLTASKMRRPVSDGALTVGSNVMGQTREGVPLKRSFFQGINAHFHPLEALGEKGKSIQHYVKGRRGLEDVYAADKQLHQQLKPLSKTRPVATDLSARLMALSESGPRQALAKQLSQALAKVEDSSQSSARLLGDVHGLTFDPQPTLSRTMPSAESALHQLYEAFKRVTPSPGKSTAALLANFEGQGLMLPEWKPERKRDLGHPSAIIEADLIHHADTLKQLADIAEELDSVSGNSPSALKRIQASAESVMRGFEENPIHKLSSQNIASYEQAESLYDNFKLLAKDLGTPGSALHWHLSSLLGLPVDASIKDAMTHQVQQLDSGQTLSPSRTQGKSLGLMVTGIKPVAPVEFFLGASKSHTHGVSISRTDTGARVEISTDNMRRLASSVASGVTLGRGGGAVGPGLRVAGELTAAVAKNKSSSIGFDVKEADLGKMMSILMGQAGGLRDLLALGEKHAAGESSKFSADVNLDVLAQLRLMYSPQEDIAELDSVIRAGIGVVGNLNVAHADKSQSTTRSATGTSHGEGSSAQWLRQGGVGANFAPINALALGSAEAGGPATAAFALPEVSVMVKLDRGQSQAFSFSFKAPQSVTQSQIDGIQHSLSRYSPQFRRDLAGTDPSGAQGSVGEQLATLQRFLTTHPPLATKPDDYYAISQALDMLMTQQDLMNGGLRQLASVESSVTRVGLRDNGRYGWLDDVAPANKTAIVEWLQDDPQFAQIIEQLQRGDGTSVRLGMELKPEILRTIERSHLAGERTESLIKRALSDPGNLRVKSMSMSYTASQSHAMSVPAMTNLSFSSSATLSHTHKHVNVDFEYGANADKPLRMNLNDTLNPLPRPDLTIDLADQRIRTPNSVA